MLTATLDFDITAGANNSSINIAQLNDATFDPATVTTSTFDATATQFQAGDWSEKNSTKHFSYDVSTRVEAANVIAFAIYTNTGREQTLKNVQLKLEYSTGAVAKYDYELNAVDGLGTKIKTLASGDEYEGKSATAYFPYMFDEGGTLYTTATTPYSATFDKDNLTKNITYTEAASTIVAYMEGEAVASESGEDANCSNGKWGHVEGNKKATLATLPRGKYTATIYLKANPNRSIVLRDNANEDNNTNTIISLPISKTSPAGVYTTDEFDIINTTTIAFSGYTTGDGKTNQSADIDYIYITKTGELTSVSATVGGDGWATFVAPADLDFSGVAGLEAFTATTGGTTVELTKVDNVQEGTGVVLKGTAGSYDIPFAVSSSTAKGDLKSGAVADVEADAAHVYYGLTMIDGKATFAKVTSGAIAAGKAYFMLDADGAREFLTIAGEEATGIETVKAQINNNRYYNLQGVEVAQPTKGLYIVNGKKLLVK
ncbi:MAG: hypothetical protein K6G08_09135 [Prevotella sp.]|nr:hypothetical protein [Prevotella sp.]